MQSVNSLGKFILASALLHLGLLGATVFLKVKKERLVPVEISFGTGQSRGGSGPKRLAVSAHKEEVKKATTSASQKSLPSLKSLGKVKTDAPVVAAKLPLKDEVKKGDAAIAKSSTQDSNEESGSGLNTTSGSGSGTTSGSGAGFNDPKIRYRGIVRQLLDSKKHYPRKAQALQQEGTVIAKIRLNKNGKLLRVEIVESSPYQILAKATLDVINAVEKFPEIPAEIGLSEITFNVPFVYE